MAFGGSERGPASRGWRSAARNGGPRAGDGVRRLRTGAREPGMAFGGSERGPAEPGMAFGGSERGPAEPGMAFGGSERGPARGRRRSA